MRLLLTIATFLWAVSAVQAATPVVTQQSPPLSIETGNDFLRVCGSAAEIDPKATLEDSMTSAYCLGLIAGFKNGVVLTHGLLISLSHLDPILCIPDSGTTTGQLLKVVLKWMEDHPANLHQPCDLLMIFALRDAFPCAKKAPESQK